MSIIINLSRRDHQGTYFEFRKVYRPRIDATFLRVCKKFNEDATSMLYAFFNLQQWTGATLVAPSLGSTQKRSGSPYMNHSRVSILTDGYGRTFWLIISDAMHCCIEMQQPFHHSCSYYDHFCVFSTQLAKRKLQVSRHCISVAQYYFTTVESLL